MVTAYLSGGIEAVAHIAAERVRRNRRGGLREPELQAPPPAARPATVTIEDVSIDGSFPGEGFEGRVRVWAMSVRSEREPLR